MPSSGVDRVHNQLAAMIAFETGMERRIEQLLAESGTNAQVRGILDDAIAACRERRDAARARLKVIAPEAGVPDAQPAPTLLDALSGAEQHPASGALIALHGLMSQAVLGYAILVELSFRAADSVEHLGSENTGDLAWEHLRSCARATQEILRAMPYVVVDELEEDGEDCRCSCPTCGLGVCGCVLAFRRRIDLAFGEAGPLEQWPGIRLVRPREGSPAALAGLRKGDVVEAIDKEVIGSIPALQEAIKAHPPGDQLTVEVVRSDSGTKDEVLLVR